jgi:hypothetical protein
MEGGATPDATSMQDAPMGDDVTSASGDDATPTQEAAVTPGVDAASEASANDAGFVAQCLPDGNGRLTLVTTGGLALNVQQGNDADCSLGSGPLNMLDGSGYTLGTDAPLAGGNGKHLEIYIAVPGALQGDMGSYSAQVEILTYSDAVHLSDEKKWQGNCTVDITMMQKIAQTTAVWTYEVTGSVTCSTPLASMTIDGGAGGDPALQITTLTFVTAVFWI